jgi:hypothetical protein
LLKHSRAEWWHLGLVFEPLEQLLGHESRSQHLQRDDAMRILLLGLKDQSHSPFANDRSDDKIAYALRRGQIRGGPGIARDNGFPI